MEKLTKMDLQTIIAGGKSFTGFIAGNLVDNIPDEDGISWGLKVKFQKTDELNKLVNLFEHDFLTRFEGFGNEAIFFAGESKPQ